jgi:paraquat-inducible protein B
VLDKINLIPLRQMLDEATKALAESQKTMKITQQSMTSLNNIIASKEIKVLPQDIQRTL